MNRLFAIACCLALAAGLGACKPPRTSGEGCVQDSDCGLASAFRCETRTGQCYCRTDDACQAREFCNPSGFCQDRAGCETNADCDESQFCETQSGSCLPHGRCSSDLHCPLGQVCDTNRATCVEGCHTSGDCPGSSCRCGDAPCVCAGQSGTELSSCEIGVCDSNFCADSSFCKFGEMCGIRPDAGTTRNECYSDFDEDRRPYCSNCVSGGGIDRCGTGANYCIIDTRTQNTYCGADCSMGQSCPRGYGCRDIIVVFTRWQCSATQPCPGDPTLPCGKDEDCKRGGQCLKLPGQPNGYCAGQCRVREGSAIGFCSCQVDNDCAQESCTQGECSISRRRCITEQDCRPIHCVDFNGAGGCLIGQNCTPANGLTCVEVR